MDNLEEKIMDVLNDPQKLGQIMDIAKGLGFSPEQEPIGEAPAFDPQMTGTVMNLLRQAGTQDGRQDALFHALMPYLQPNRQKKLQRALKVAKLSHLAGYALKNYSDQI